MPHLAIVGATGAVGSLMRRVVLERKLPYQSIKFLASSRSAGQSIEFAGKPYKIEALSPEAFRGIDLALSSMPASVSKEWSPIATRAGAYVVDNSSAWRMDPEVPLVVPEVNAHALKNIPKKIIANPNCSTIQMVVALQPLHAIAKIKRIVVATYQASSGKGATGLFDLDAQVAALGQGKTIPTPTAHTEQLAGNVIAHDWKLGEDGYSEEETKMVKETKKIMGDESIQVAPTTVRVPVRTGHSEAINIEFHSPISVEQAKAALAQAPGIILMDGYGPGLVPTPLQAEDRDEVFVGRVRKDSTVLYGLQIWVVADNLRKGAATNAVHIAQELIKLGIVR